MKIAIIATGVALLAALLFPPVDHVVRGSSAIRIGDISRSASPDQRYSRGLMFIGDVSGNYDIRTSQWLIHMAAVAAVGGIAVAATRSKK